MHYKPMLEAYVIGIYIGIDCTGIDYMDKKNERNGLKNRSIFFKEKYKVLQKGWVGQQGHSFEEKTQSVRQSRRLAPTAQPQYLSCHSCRGGDVLSWIGGTALWKYVKYSL